MFELLLFAVGLYVIFSKINNKNKYKPIEKRKDNFFDFKDRDLKNYFKEQPKEEAKQTKQIVPPKKKKISESSMKKDKNDLPVNIHSETKKEVEEGIPSSLEIKKTPSPREMFLYHELLSKPKSLRK